MGLNWNKPFLGLAPRSLRWQFRLAFLLLASLIAMASLVSIGSFHQSVTGTRELAGERLAQMEAAQELGKSAILVELETHRLLAEASEERMQACYARIIPLLDQLDRLTDQLGNINDDIAVLAMHQAEQIFRNIIHVSVGLRTTELREGALTGGDKIRQRFSDELQHQALEMVAAATTLSVHSRDDYQTAVRNLAAEAEKSRRLVLIVFAVSLVVSWLFFYFVLERGVLTRLHTINRFLLGGKTENIQVLIPIQDADEITAMARSVEQFIEDRRQLALVNQALQQTNDMLHGILDAAPTAIIDMDLEGNVRSIWNASAEKMLGWKADDVLGKPLPTLQAENEEELRELRKQIRNGASFNGLEVQRRRRDGSPIDYSIYASPLRSPEGDIIGNISVFVDISGRKRMESELRETRNRLSVIVKTMPDLIWLKDVNGVYLACNPEFELFFGSSESEILGKTDYDFVPRDLADFFRQKDNEVLADGDIRINEEEVVYRSDGRHVILETRKVPVMDAEGGILGVLGIGRNITDRKRMASELRRREQYQRTLLDNFPFFVWLKDKDSRLLAANLEYARVAQVDAPSELEGKTDFDFFPHDLAEKYVADDRAVMAAKIPKHVEEEYADENGLRNWMETWKAPLVIDGEVVGTVGYSRDITERKQMEAALADNERKFRSLAEGSSDNIIRYDLEQRIRYLNQHLAEFLGIGCIDEVIGRRSAEIWPDGRFRPIEKAVDRVIKTGKQETVELTVPTSSGESLYHQVSVVPERDADGAIVGTLAFGRDITALKRAQESLAESETMLRAIIEAAPVAIIGLDLDGNVHSVWNKAAETMLGWSAAEVMGHPLPTVPANKEEEFRRFRDQIRNGLTLNGVEVSRHRRDGSPIDYSIYASPLYDGNDAVTGNIAVMVDISERKQMEEKLHLSETRLRDILGSTSDWIWEVDTEGRYTFCSEGIEKVLKYRPEEILGSTPFDLMPPGERERVGAVFMELVGHKAPLVDLENWNLTKNGRRVCLMTNGVPILDDQGNLLGYRGADRDITVQKLLQAQVQERTGELERSNRELEQFAYAVSHDLQEPLRMVASYVKLLARRYQSKLDSDADEFINYAADGAERMQRMINDLLAYSRITTKGRKPEPVDSADCLSAALANLSLAIEEAGAEVSSDALPQVLADESQLSQLFQNLVGNALKFRKPEDIPRVHLGAVRREKEWLFSVRDNGIGIKKEDQDRIFQLFQRLHSREEYPGTGIGLSLCQRIVARHGGRIWVESEPGLGATFYFTLPSQKECDHV